MNGGVIFDVKDGRLVMANLNDGTIRWTQDGPAPPPADDRSLVVWENELLAASISAPGRVQSLNIENGKINWTIDSPIGSPGSELAVNATTIAFSAFGGQLVLIDRASHATRYIDRDAIKSLPPDLAYAPSAAFAGDILVTPSSAGLIAFRP